MLHKGISVGGLLDNASGELEIYPDLFSLILKSGFDLVRLPVNWAVYTEEVFPYHINPDFMKFVVQTVDEALAEGLIVVINMHGYNELMMDPENHELRFLAIWRQISKQFSGYPDSLLFELINEPCEKLTPEVCFKLHSELLRVIRIRHPFRKVVISPMPYGNIGALQNLKLPHDDDIIVDVHYYEPISFTHQGVDWMPEAEMWIGETWDGTPADKHEVRQALGAIVKFQREHHIPVWIGEFGVHQSAGPNYRQAWTEFIRHECERRDITWIYWEFFSDFGVFDLANGCFIDNLYRALIPPQSKHADAQLRRTGPIPRLQEDTKKCNR